MSDGEIVKEFLVESYENLDRLDQDLVALDSRAASSSKGIQDLQPSLASRF